MASNNKRSIYKYLSCEFDNVMVEIKSRTAWTGFVLFENQHAGAGIIALV